MGERTRALRVDAETIFHAAVDRVMPEKLFSYCLSLEGSVLSASDGQMTRKYDLSRFEHIVIAAFGKAAVPMAVSLVSLLGGRVSQGLVVTKVPEDGRPSRLAPQTEKVFAAQSIHVIGAGHPVPDQRSVLAGQEMLAFASRVREWEGFGSKTFVCVLISGGGSALLSAPAQGLSLGDKAEVTRLLLACGATIHEINTVRKHLSAIKGGFLARAFFPAETLALVLSDVMGDDLDVIASGPTVPDMSTWRDVKAIFDRFGLFGALPEAVVRATEEGLSGARAETPKPGDAIFDSCSTMLVGTNFHAILEAERTSQRVGLWHPRHRNPHIGRSARDRQAVLRDCTGYCAAWDPRRRSCLHHRRGRDDCLSARQGQGRQESGDGTLGAQGIFTFPASPALRAGKSRLPFGRHRWQ